MTLCGVGIHRKKFPLAQINADMKEDGKHGWLEIRKQRGLVLGIGMFIYD